MMMSMKKKKEEVHHHPSHIVVLLVHHHHQPLLQTDQWLLDIGVTGGTESMKRVGETTEGVTAIVQNGKCSTVGAEAVVHHKDQDNRDLLLTTKWWHNIPSLPQCNNNQVQVSDMNSHLVFLANLALILTSFVCVYCKFSWQIKIYTPHKYKWNNCNIFHIKTYNLYLLLIC